MTFVEAKQRLKELFKLPEHYANNEVISKFKLDDRYLKLGFKLENYQVPAAWMLSSYRDVLYVDEPGMGKTPVTIAAMSDMYANGRRKFLVVALASILGQWKDSFKKFSTFDVSFAIGTKEKRYSTYREFYSGKTDVLLVSYNTLITDFSVIKRLTFDTMICDECDYFKSPKSQIYKVISHFSYKVTAIKLLTGTPFNGKLEDTFAPLSVVSHGQYTVQWLTNYFCNLRKLEVPIYDKFTGRKRTVKTNIIDSYKNLEYFKQIIGCYIFGRKSTDVGACLPSTKEHYIPVRKSKELISYEKLIVSGVFVDTKSNKIKLNSLQKISYLHRGFHSLNMLYPETPLPNPKKSALLDLIDSLGEEQVAIFSNYKEIPSEIYPILKERGGCSRCDGGITGTSRLKSIEDFKSGKNQFIMLTLAGYAGIDLYNCRNLIFIDYIYNRAKFGQIQGRIIRKNSKFKEVNLYYLYYDDSIDTAVLKLLSQREKQINFFESDEAVSKRLLNEISKPDGISLKR